LPPVTQFMVERRLMEVSKRLAKLREELAVAEEQADALADLAEDARVRALVSETPLAGRESQEARRHADAMAGARDQLAGQVVRLESELNELLDKLTAD
jgi:chromosome segregation ATPase